MRRFISYGPAFVVLLTAGTVLFALPRAIKSLSAIKTHQRVELARQSLADDDILERFNAAIRNVADSVEPSVVHIEVGRWRGATGSGWTYDEQGHIITNAHVVGPARKVTVQFFDGRLAEGTVIGADSLSDIAVVKVEAGEHLVPAERASTERVQQGDRVFAFGSPFGFKFSMSEGIVSGLGRTARAVTGVSIQNFIQTDAAVNPGNSGGPLTDIRGRVVGMNVAIANAGESEGGTSGQSAGISFAIPLATIESRVDQIIETGTVRQGYLGVQFSPEPVEIDSAFVSGKGVRIIKVVPGAAADLAGIKANDIVMTMDGYPVQGSDSLSSFIRAKRPGATIDVEVLRDEKLVKLTVKLGEMPDDVLAGQFEETLRLLAGLELSDTKAGATVAWVASKFSDNEPSPAKSAGLEVGQVIVKVNGEDVTDATSALMAMYQNGLALRKTITLRVKAKDEAGEEVEKEIKLRVNDR